MATQLPGAGRRRRPGLRQTSFTRTSETGTRHPAVAVAMVLPVAILLLAFFGGWEQLATQTKAVADLIGR